MLIPVEIRHFHLFAGLGGGARGFNRGEARLGQQQARFRCIGGIDVDPAAMRDFQRLAGVPGTVLDMFDREQYTAFHDHEPPPGWREATPADIQRAAGGERPHIVFLSAPCKGFSGLLSETKSKTAKYQALNRLTLRGMLPTGFMLTQPQSWHPDVWTDVTRMRTLNGAQSAAGRESHLCPMQFDIADRAIRQLSNPGDVVLDPFAGIGTVPYRAVLLGRVGHGVELARPYFLDACGYCEAAVRQMSMPSLFDLDELEAA